MKLHNVNSSIRLLLSGLSMAFATMVSHRVMADSPTAVLREGVKAFRAGNTEEAARLFEQARQLAEEQGKPLPSADYNLGRTAAERGEWDRALDHFQTATRTEDLTLLEDSHYNSAAALLMKPEPSPEDKEALKGAINDMEKALSALRHTLSLSTEADDARRNFEIATDRRDQYRQRLKELEEQEQQNEEQDKSEDEKNEEKEEKKEQEKNQEKDQNQEQNNQDQQDQNKEPSEDGQEPEKNPSQPEPGEEDQPQPQPSDDGQNQNTPADSEPSDSQGGDEQPMNLSPEESQSLLNAIREQEAKNRQEILHRMMMRERAKPVPVEKDW
jgi:Ca-activated chloride channel homolog